MELKNYINLWIKCKRAFIGNRLSSLVKLYNLEIELFYGDWDGTHGFVRFRRIFFTVGYDMIYFTSSSQIDAIP